MIKPIINNAIGLAIFAVFTAGVIAVTQFITKDEIQFQQEQYAAKTLFELLPDPLENDNLLKQTIALNSAANWQQLPLLGLRSDNHGWYANDEHGIAAVVLPAIARGGYSGDINILVAIDRQGTLLGVRVIEHKETPGLGDRIETKKSDWVLQFEGNSLRMPAPELWAVNKDGGEITHDQLTGATITPRAIVAAIKSTLEFYQLNQPQLLNWLEANNGN